MSALDVLGSGADRLTPGQGREGNSCTCTPCTDLQYGVTGLAHCAGCCMGTKVEEFDFACPDAEHREMARRQFGTSADSSERHDLRCPTWLLPDVCTCRDEHGHTSRHTEGDRWPA